MTHSLYSQRCFCTENNPFLLYVCAAITSNYLSALEHRNSEVPTDSCIIYS